MCMAEAGYPLVNVRADRDLGMCWDDGVGLNRDERSRRALWKAAVLAGLGIDKIVCQDCYALTPYRRPEPPCEHAEVSA